MLDLPGTGAHCEGHCAGSFVLTKAVVLFCYTWPTCILIAVLNTHFNNEKCFYLVIKCLLSLVLEGKQYSVKTADLIDSELSCVIGFVTKLNY